MTAYNGELNAREKYLAFAAKAEEEGFLKAAQLFKAAALSKEVHAAKRAELIKSLGDTPKADIRKQTVRSTKENIAEAIKLENYETASLYPGFLSQAGKDDIRGAVLGFNSAIKVGAGRKKLFIEAQNNLASWKQPSAGFYVCRVCGNLVKTIDFEYCPICKVPSSEFTTVK
ncbi:MAG: hypothetical protein A2204_06430 [Elusimicrobia bacterium RIFOXYA1_FULL_47_7]|nr:MAG: hypothetical protein A2278_05510 [Elusimicrobia bacterium RIFOXYA12_FULL_49_49]OGS09572.1 MAG: hypothetical protein A2204_06430 [Elusimicrobia bacterium RIFOXYA1_FULL_47_7]OGS14892.1 MAG: hypothetical protein A2251_04880 [Elusimicrobia bacterium RIFOXYA2_FULL_47_53]OGS26500.1 MAG: hypothetical protein A2339_05305 [Elusimicrobia bacterium RIFOXYB12_FULL_50_12]OGS29860.1 MAG: hypothetical protein A2323_06580 [Elusimicrobia bacterium RIFOXYB2_FULL_46_23]